MVSIIKLSVPENMHLEKLDLVEGVLGMGLYKIIIAYLTKPSLGVLADKRHQLVKLLIDFQVYVVNQPLIMEYS